ncbi:RNA-binding protein 48 [Crotalus adamanteus]|uniref:RNA-binding protein 48 n=1 Tax=Crotalus adamanteus TaxID=8729 RepID=A0AAW1B252_CROAD
MAAVDTGEEVGGVCQHHAQQTICASRAKYREGRRPRAVKVYTVNLESRYLLIQGVPALGVMKELIELFALYGTVEEYNPLDGYPAEEFTEVYLIKFLKIQSARAAKRKLDERNFFGSLLHICYAPEFESVQETRDKLKDRRKYIAKATSCKEQSLETKQDCCIRSSKIMPFMPRTTQLQERKRRRDEDNKLALLGREPNGEEIIFGPKLPETPKIDMDDDSLNTSANLIRNRLKKIADPVQTLSSSEELLVENQTKPVIKQRRRI